MGKGYGIGLFNGTAGYNAEVKRLINTLPKNPDTLIQQGWREITHASVLSKGVNPRIFIEPKTGLTVHFDKARANKPGFEGKDHYHVRNPNSTGKKDYYLDKEGNPVPAGSKKSHIVL